MTTHIWLFGIVLRLPLFCLLVQVITEKLQNLLLTANLLALFTHGLYKILQPETVMVIRSDHTGTRTVTFRMVTDGGGDGSLFP